MSKVFVTGPDGVLGSNIVRELLSRNYEVKVLVFGPRQPITLKGLPIEIVEGDITNKEQVIELSKGCDYFINVAAITDMWPTRGAIYFKINVKLQRERSVSVILCLFSRSWLACSCFCLRSCHLFWRSSTSQNDCCTKSAWVLSRCCLCSMRSWSFL